MAVRLIATDLDGTLFDVDHRPAPRTVAAINAAVDAGIHICAATGRSWFRGLDLAVSTGARLHHFIGSNGGHRVHATTREIEERLVFPRDTIRAVMADLRATLGEVGYGYELADDLAWDDRFVDLSPINLEGLARPRSALAEDRVDEIGKMFVAHPDLTTIDLVDAIAPLVPPGVNVTTSGATFVELTPDGADNGAAVDRLAQRLGIAAHEVLAFGDNQNDLTLLAWAGRGVAMANALPMVKDVADEVTASNVDFGVASVIEDLLDLG